MLNGYSVTGCTKKGGYATWRYDALSFSAIDAKKEAIGWWDKERPASAVGFHLFNVTVKKLPKKEFPVCLGHWFKTGEETKDGHWLTYELPKIGEE